MFSICFRRFEGAGFDVPDIILEHLGRQCLSATMRYFPLCDFSARIVATMTQASASARCNGI